MTFFSKWYSSSMPGAPVLNGLAGSLISVLDACFSSGFGSTSASGLTVTGGIATITFPSAHAFQQLSIVEVSGSDPAGLNGEKRVIAVGAGTLQFLATGIPDGAATGTIVVRLPPSGFWEKAFSGTNKAAYRCINALVQGNLLQVDDSGSTADAGKAAHVRGYESMTDVDNGTNPFPTTALVAAGNGLRWVKSYYADAGARSWDLVVTDRIFYLFVDPAKLNSPGIALQFFGDPWPSKAVSPYVTTVTGYVGSVGIINPTGWLNGTNNGANSNAFFARAYGEAVGSVKAYAVIPGDSVRGNLGTGTFANPDPVSGRVWAAPFYLGDAEGLVRGRLPILHEFLHSTAPVANGSILTDMAGCTQYCRAFICSGTSTFGNFMIDLGASE